MTDKTKAFLVKVDIDKPSLWVEALKQRRPEFEYRTWPDVGDVNDIVYALVWKPDPGLLQSLPNLQAIFSYAAGVDHILADPDLPKNVPIIRMVEETLTSGMREYVLLSVLAYQRHFYELRRLQENTIWKQIRAKAAWETKIGIMGLGELGADVAHHLQHLGYDVAGWARSAKDIPGVTSFAGEAQLESFLARSEMLVCMLPLTEETRGILNADLFAKLPKGAYLINVGRGPHLVEDDLLQALQTGRIASATLDVFYKEPLPQDHPFWSHPQIVITPHIASLTHPETAADSVVENIARMERGEAPRHVYDWDAGY